jgi:predicted metal-dependent phosphoesterase TrpH
MMPAEERSMIIDLHTHEYLFSPCGRMSLEEAVAHARRIGLDGLCITDHNSLDIRHAACLRTLDFPVFVGVEMTTREGDMVAFGLDSLPRRQPTAQEFADFVAGQGGFSFAAHPFRSWGGGMRRHMRSIRNMHGVEVFNGANPGSDNTKALRACGELGLIPVAGSDAHAAGDIGSYATSFPEPIRTLDELVAALKAGRGCPVVRDKGGYRTPDSRDGA